MWRCGLCLALTLWMAGTRPSAAVWSESSRSSPWWEAEEFRSISETAPALRASGDWASLASLYERGYQEAKRKGILPAQVSYLVAMGNVRTLRFQFSPALAAYLEGKRVAEVAGDWTGAGFIAVNLTGLYQQVWDSE